MKTNKRTRLVWALLAIWLGWTACPALAEPYFLISSYDDWNAALSGATPHITAMETLAWQEYMHQWSAHLQEGAGYPTTEFAPAHLYASPDGRPPINPPDAGMVMVWAPQTGMQPGNYASAWEYDYGLDPDLRNCTIRVTVTPPQWGATGQVNAVSFGIRDTNGNIRSWWWRCPAPIPWWVTTTITIDTSRTGLAATTPAATGYANNPGFDLSNAADFIVDENAVWLGGPLPVPPFGAQVPAGLWNYWHDLLVVPNAPANKQTWVKWSQPPVVTDPNFPQQIMGWDEMSRYDPQMWPLLADDWLCQDERSITDIHWWGSFLGWNQPGRLPSDAPTAFQLAIWTDVPAGPTGGFSHPGTVLWEHRCENWVWNFAGYDHDPRVTKIADNPLVSVAGNEDLFPYGWWVRGQSTSVTFTFNGLNPAGIASQNVEVRFALGATNHLDGEKGLDGLLDVTINPGQALTQTFTNVLFDNLDPTNLVRLMGGGGTYETTAKVLVDKNYIQAGTLVVRVSRRQDVKDNQPLAPVGTNQPIDMSTNPPTIPAGCYDFNDAHTVHVNVATTDAGGTIAANGEVTLWESPEPEACFQFNQLLSEPDWFRQKTEDPNGTVYWLSIGAIYPGQTTVEHPFGWKTRPDHWNDDAVRFNIALDPSGQPGWPPAKGWSWMEGVPLEYGGQSWDVSFELTTNEKPPCHDLSSDLNHDCIVNLKDLAIMCGEWLKTSP